MKLRMESHHVSAIQLGPKTALTKGALTINGQELCRVACYDDSIQEVKVELASPGEETRIIHVLEAIEPRTKVSGDRTAFP